MDTDIRIRKYTFEPRLMQDREYMGAYSVICNSAVGAMYEEIMLENELDVIFSVVDDKIYVHEGSIENVNGSVIDLDEGNADVIEKYFPGLEEQIVDKIKEGVYRK